ncbi:nickel/cobalt transporter [Aliarcobacter cryaerophilus]|uniref:Nickel/cobalt efflux system n=2 Tax=Aliarcobacter cryaerophilus TaxID=28198 RepID=A0A2S9TN42_9BACT|nr:DUF1007 family protein [Aliarcobacter cryaerophilus]PRN00259.1 sodium:proton antiporter [Arcobacter cryaerophilus gv. pseudocryaerophilus]
MIRFLVLFFILKGILFGCALCSVYTPKTNIFTDIKLQNDSIKNIDIKWEFEKEFTDELLLIYDLNLDKSFDEKELKLIEDSLVEYLFSKNFITNIYFDNGKKERKLDFVVKKYKISFKNRILRFEYNLELNQTIYDKSTIKIVIFDKDGYFFTIFEAKNQKLETIFQFNKSTKINEVNYIFNDNKLSLNVEDVKNEDSINNIFQQEKEEDIKFEEEQGNIPKNRVDRFVEDIKKYLVDIENGDKIALFFLLIASFTYGVIHSIGPGHGKFFAFSYFSSQKSTYFEAFIISLLTAFVHIFGALLIVLISILILQTALSGFVSNSTTYITALSAVIIMFLAMFILYRKLKKKYCSCSVCKSDIKATKFSSNFQKINFIAPSKNKPVIFEKRDKKQDLIFVLTAGIVPCPGTILLFMYAFLLKTYFAVFLASIFISIGMAVVIFSSSFFGVSLHKISSNSKNIVNVLEIVAPIFMFILALLMLIGSGIFS